MSLPPIHDGPSTGKKKRGAKTIRHYTDALKAANKDVNKGEQIAADQWWIRVNTPHEQRSRHWSADYGPWSFIWRYELFLKLLREAQNTHPGHSWGYPEG